MHPTVFNLLVSYLLVSFFSVYSDERVAENYTECEAAVEVLVSPLVTEEEIGEVRVYWWARRRREGDMVRLWRGWQLLKEATVTEDSGWLDTGHYHNQTDLPPDQRCHQFTATYLRSDHTVVAESCLGIHPRWMQDFKGSIGSLSIAQLFIPGTHNSASYKVSDSGYIELSIHKYVFTQDMTVLDQLLHGARYLDLRVASYPHREEEWWANHNIYPVLPLSKVISQILHFVNMTQEVVILDLHGFPLGFRSYETHRRLGKWLMLELEPWLHRPKRFEPWRVSLSDLLEGGGKIVLSYNVHNITKEFPWFYPPIRQHWGDVDTLPRLEEFLNMIMPHDHTRNKVAWAAMSQLTPSTTGFLFDMYGGLRRMGDQVNGQLSTWVRTRDWAPNIVAVDFIRSVAIVSAAINQNLKRAGAFNCTALPTISPRPPCGVDLDSVT